MEHTTPRKWARPGRPAAHSVPVASAWCISAAATSSGSSGSSFSKASLSLPPPFVSLRRFRVSSFCSLIRRHLARKTRHFPP